MGDESLISKVSFTLRKLLPPLLLPGILIDLAIKTMCYRLTAVIHLPVFCTFLVCFLFLKPQMPTGHKTPTQTQTHAC